MLTNRLLFYVVALVVIGCVILFGNNSAIAGAIDLPKTGQTTCYDSEGDVISCEGTGQDGDIRAGFPWPTPRFTDNGDGTVTDNLTGLMWLKDADCFGSRDWDSALRRVKDFNSNPGDYACWEYNGKYNDWVLPNVNELDSLNNSEESYSGTWLEDQGFMNVQQSHDSYWSSTTDVSSANYWPSVPARYAWAVDIRGSILKRERKDNHYYHIWPIRTGQTGSTKIPKTGQTTSYADGDDGDLQRGAEWPVPRFTDDGDGTVTDNLTGLMWLKGACFQNKTWQEALDAIADFNDNPESLSWCGGYTGTYNDWRLPNKNELHSLTDFSQHWPALPSEHPFLHVDTDKCWTSTTSAILEECKWYVSMQYGNASYCGNPSVAWPVRTGQKGETEIPAEPVLTVSTSETSVTVSWTSVAIAIGYTLFYAPYPYTGPDSIGSVDMGNQTVASFDLWRGAAYYVAVQAYNGVGNSSFSNIEYFAIGSSISVIPTTLGITVGETGACTISNGTSPYNARSNNTSVATVSVSGGTASVTGVSVGFTTITVHDSTDDLASVSVTVTKGTPASYTNSLGQTFVLLPAGTFIMGSPSDEPGRWGDETQHQVTLTQPFYMQTTEVTQAQWEAVMGSNPSNNDGCPTCPVEWVHWRDVQDFITKMNTQGEGTYSLPTEAQWEYAARAGSITAFANGKITETGCGNDPNLNAMGWYCYNADGRTHSVAQKLPNAWGLYDMYGNVYEWCQDWWGYYSSGAVTDPTGPSSGLSKINRGGARGWGAKYCRSASRYKCDNPGTRSPTIGFRLLRLP